MFPYWDILGHNHSQQQSLVAQMAQIEIVGVVPTGCWAMMGKCQFSGDVAGPQVIPVMPGDSNPEKQIPELLGTPKY